MSEDFVKQALYRPDLSPLFLMLILGAAFLLGAIHALGPGHGKSLMAAYLVGARGRVRDAVVLALTITFSHVFSVILIGFAAFVVMDVFWSEKVSVWLGIVSGIIITVIGIWLFIQRLQVWHMKQNNSLYTVRTAEKKNSSKNHNDHHHSSSNHSHRHKLLHSSSDPNISIWSNVTLGISSGIVPCPKALVILLLAVSLQKEMLGITIVTIFSMGMALVLVGIGITLVKASHLLKNRFQSRRIQILPIIGSIIIIILGFIITIRTVQLL
jgi:ABC-type nickel/cobalt efflux system permease component RcnA